MPKRHAEEGFADRTKRRLIDQLSALSLEARFPESKLESRLRSWSGSGAGDEGLVSDGDAVSVDPASSPPSSSSSSSSSSSLDPPGFVIDPAYLKIPASVTESSGPDHGRGSVSMIPYVPWKLVLWNNLMNWLKDQGRSESGNDWDSLEIDMDDDGGDADEAMELDG